MCGRLAWPFREHSTRCVRLESMRESAMMHTSLGGARACWRKKMKIWAICPCALVCVLGWAAGTPAQEAKHAITFEDMIKMHRVSEAQISPDGKWVAYAVTTPDLDANRNASNLWLVATSSGEAMQLTQSGHDSSPAWSPDGKTIAFLSSRSGDSQVYLLSMEGGEAKQLTHLSTGADLVKWSPDGKTILFTS